jgi:MFS transporter, ACS family, tartrate transporter
VNSVATGGSEIERTTMRKVLFRLVPFLMVCYFFALLDRVHFKGLVHANGLRVS